MRFSTRSRQPFFLGCVVLAGLGLMYLASWWQKINQDEQDRMMMADLQDQMDQMEMDAFAARMKPSPPLPKKKMPGLMAREQKGDIVGTKWHGGKLDGRPFLSGGRLWEFRQDSRVYHVERDSNGTTIEENSVGTYNQEEDRIVISLDGFQGTAEFQRKTDHLSGKMIDFPQGKEFPLILEQVKE